MLKRGLCTKDGGGGVFDYMTDPNFSGDLRLASRGLNAPLADLVLDPGRFLFELGLGAR